jgi:hypothetical protein
MAGMGDLRKFESTQQSDVQDWRIKDEEEEEQGSGAGQAFTAAPVSDPWGVTGIDATADAYVGKTTPEAVYNTTPQMQSTPVPPGWVDKRQPVMTKTPTPPGWIDQPDLRFVSPQPAQTPSKEYTQSSGRDVVQPQSVVQSFTPPPPTDIIQPMKSQTSQPSMTPGYQPSGALFSMPQEPQEINLPEPSLPGIQVGSGSPWYMYEGIGSPLTFGAGEPSFVMGQQEKSWNGEAPSMTMIPNRPITQADMAQTQADAQKWNAERRLPGYGAGADTLQGQVYREAQMVNNQVPTFRDAGANYLRSGPARTTDETTKKVITPVKKKFTSGGSRGGAWGSRANSWQEILNSMNWKIS